MNGGFTYERPRCARCRELRLQRSYLCIECWRSVTAIPEMKWWHGPDGKVVVRSA